MNLKFTLIGTILLYAVCEPINPHPPWHRNDILNLTNNIFLLNVKYTIAVNASDIL